MFKRNYSFISICIVLVTIVLFLIPAISAGSTVITSPTGRFIVTPWSTQISFYGYQESIRLPVNDATQPSAAPGSSSIGCVGTQSGDYTGNYPLRFDTSHDMCSGFDIPQDNGTQQPETNNSPTPEITPVPIVTPYPTPKPEGSSQFSYIPIDILFPHLTPVDYFSTGYMPLVPHTNPAIYYPEAQGLSYERNFT